MAQVSQINPVTKDLRDEETDDKTVDAETATPEGVEIFEVYGSLFFGAVEQFKDTISVFTKKPRVFILETQSLLAIDATGIHAMEELVKDLSRQEIHFLLSGIHKQPLFALQQAGVIDLIDEDNLCGTLAEARLRAAEIIKKKEKQ